MSIKLQLPKLTDLKPRLTVIGVGGAGGNALNNMIASGLTGVSFVAANTDAQALSMTAAEHRLQLGINLTEGLGAGSKPEIGRAAAEEAIEDIRQQLSGSHMCFIAAGMGGGTGTGAAPVMARIAKEMGVLTVGVVTKPFQFEGTRRMRMAEAGIVELRQHVDTLIVIPNQNLFRIATERTTFAEAFRLADQVLHSGVACIVDLIVRDGLINLDFADVRTVMANMGNAMMGTGEAGGELRAIEAAEAAIQNPLIDDVSLKGAKGLLLSVTGGRDLTLFEVDEAASRIRQEVDPDANIIVGATFDDSLQGKMRVSIVASGIAGADGSFAPRPVPAPSQTAPDRAERVSAHGMAQTYGQPVHVAPLAPTGYAGGSAGDNRNFVRQQQTDEPPLDLDVAIAPEAPAAVWQGPGDVQIVERLPQLASSGATQRHSIAPPQPEAIWIAPAQFRPAPPVELHPAGRRVPEIADFPAVAQREYRSKAQTPAEPQPPNESQRPKFFQRWTNSLQRRLNESPTNYENHKAAYDVQDFPPEIARPSYGTAFPSQSRYGNAEAAQRQQSESGQTGFDQTVNNAAQAVDEVDVSRARKR